ncbi:MAG: DUF924 family protein [Cyanobacteria bacterium P01_F01_bin.150]
MTPTQSETGSVSESSLFHEAPLVSDSALAEQKRILEFWFGVSNSPNASYAARRRVWFGKDEAVDQQIHDLFYETYNHVIAEDCKTWQTSPEGCLSLILILDQFPRNMFRGQSKAYEADAQALKITQRALAQAFDRELLPVQRMFLYLPLEHSENRDHQAQAVTLFQALADEHQEFKDTYVYALKHQAVIERFGRFPHRNKILDRSSTPEEIEFLKEPGSSF